MYTFRSLDLHEFRSIVRKLVKEKGFSVSREGEELAFALCDSDKDGRLNYEEFIMMLYDRQVCVYMYVLMCVCVYVCLRSLCHSCKDGRVNYEEFIMMLYDRQVCVYIYVCVYVCMCVCMSTFIV
jgi:hypothetical protein